LEKSMSATELRSAAIAAARAVLEATETWFPYKVRDGDAGHVICAGGYVARGRRLLGGLAVLAEAGEDDSVGTLYRTLLETYMAGTFVLLGEENALEVLQRSLKFEVHHFESVLTGESRPRPEDAERLKLSDYKAKNGLVERLDKIFASHKDSYRGWAPTIHRDHYRVTSLHDAHGGLGCLTGHFAPEDGSILPQRDTGYPTAPSVLLHHAVAHVGSFAGIWGLRAGIDITH
jgi:hypothetical protein